MCLYTYLRLCVYACIFMFCVCVSIYVYFYVCGCVCVYVWKLMFLCVCIYKFSCFLVCVGVYIFIRVCMCVYFYVCVCVHARFQSPLDLFFLYFFCFILFGIIRDVSFFAPRVHGNILVGSLICRNEAEKPRSEINIHEI